MQNKKPSEKQQNKPAPKANDLPCKTKTTGEAPFFNPERMFTR